MKRLILGIILCSVALAGPGRRGHFEGLSGRTLADAVREAYLPVNIDIEGWRPAMWMLPGTHYMTFVPEEWWYEGAEIDLYNYFGSTSRFADERYDYPPGQVETVFASGDGWKTGVTSDINFWEPAEDRRGDASRRMMYMALMYPQTLWCSRAATVFEDGPWPLLSRTGQRIYLAWHRADPADERELKEMADIAAMQGNLNPFVDMPELAEYLWGAKAGLGYVEPETEKERVPLRGEYSKSKDKEIDLYSPHVVEDALWKFDGKEIDGRVVDLTTVSAGIHELAFSSSVSRGCVVIRVVP